MHQTRKGNQWFFGMKAPIGVDKDSGLIHSVATTFMVLSSAMKVLRGEIRSFDPKNALSAT